MNVQQKRATSSNRYFLVGRSRLFHEGHNREEVEKRLFHVQRRGRRHFGQRGSSNEWLQWAVRSPSLLFVQFVSESGGIFLEVSDDRVQQKGEEQQGGVQQRWAHSTADSSRVFLDSFQCPAFIRPQPLQPALLEQPADQTRLLRCFISGLTQH